MEPTPTELRGQLQLAALDYVVRATVQAKKIPQHGLLLCTNGVNITFGVLVDWHAVRPAMVRAVRDGAVAVVVVFPFLTRTTPKHQRIGLLASDRGEQQLVAEAYSVTLSLFDRAAKREGALADVAPYLIPSLDRLWSESAQP